MPNPNQINDVSGDPCPDCGAPLRRVKGEAGPWECSGEPRHLWNLMIENLDQLVMTYRFIPKERSSLE